MIMIFQNHEKSSLSKPNWNDFLYFAREVIRNWIFRQQQSVVKSFIPLLGRRRILFLKCNLWLKQFRCEKTRFFPMLEWQHHHFHHRRSRCRYHHKKDMWSTTKKGALLCQLSPWTTYIVHSWGEIWLTPYRGVQFFQISLIFRIMIRLVSYLWKYFSNNCTHFCLFHAPTGLTRNWIG